MHLTGSSAVAEMSIDDARWLALRAHHGQRDRDGRLHYDHLCRVVEMLPRDCQRVAWLHDIVEDTDTSIIDLELAGLPRVERDSVKLLTRVSGVPYMVYVNRIAKSDDGRAKLVKEADLLDNLRRCLRAGDSAADRYRRALVVLLGEAT